MELLKLTFLQVSRIGVDGIKKGVGIPWEENKSILQSEWT